MEGGRLNSDHCKCGIKHICSVESSGWFRVSTFKLLFGLLTLASRRSFITCYESRLAARCCCNHQQHLSKDIGIPSPVFSSRTTGGNSLPFFLLFFFEVDKAPCFVTFFHFLLIFFLTAPFFLLNLSPDR